MRTDPEFVSYTYWKQEKNSCWLPKTFSCLHSSPFLNPSSDLVKNCLCSPTSPSLSKHLRHQTQSTCRWQKEDSQAWPAAPPVPMAHLRRARGHSLHEFVAEEMVLLQRWSHKAVKENISGVQTHCEPSGPVLAQQEPGSNWIGLLPFTAWL